MTARRFRLGFRTKLGLIMTGVFIAAGAGLLTVQYFIVQQLFVSAIQVTEASCLAQDIVVDIYGNVVSTGCAMAGVTSMPATGTTQTLDGMTPTAPVTAVLQQSAFLSDEVTGGLLFWSIVTLVVFAAIAAAIAFWLAKRSLDRIGEVTAAARLISERDLDRRLSLPGPDDEIKELGDTFDGMLDRLQLAFAAQDRFVANASHELRTPLTTTRTALEIPLEHGDVPPNLQAAVRTALRATEQSERLIAALLSLARGRAGAEQFELVDLAEVVDAELEELAEAATARGISITSETEPATVEGDATLLARAVRNLLDNGIRHNVPGGSLRVTLRRSTLEVESTGPRLDESTVALLTEPFYRGDASRTANGDGIGLGLAIVESIALTHGGELHLSARAGGGLIARLELPA